MTSCWTMLLSGRKSTDADTGPIGSYRHEIEALYVHRERSNTKVIDNGLANVEDDEDWQLR